MDILIIHQYFKTPEEGGAIRSYYIAEHLTRLGHNVKVITAYNEQNYKIKRLKGFEVHYLPVYYTNHLSFWSRVHAFWLFVFYTVRLLKKFQTVHLNYVISTPLSTALIALYGKKRFGIPYCFEVGDLWPEAPIQLGVLKNRLLKWGAYRLEKIAYLGAQHIIALSPDIREIIKSKVSAKQIDVVTNMSDPDLFYPEDKDSRLEMDYELEGKFTIGYLGTIGLANHLEYLVEAAKCVVDEDIVFLVMGAGAQAEKIRFLSQGLRNVRFVEPGNKKAVQRVMSVCDAIYISFRKIPVLGSGCPNKLFDGLAAGKLIIINFDGWIKGLVEKHNCGFYYDPERPQDFMTKVAGYVKDPGLLKESQQHALTLALEQFSVKKQTKTLSQVLFG